MTRRLVAVVVILVSLGTMMWIVLPWLLSSSAPPDPPRYVTWNLKSLAMAQSDFRANDRDGNRLNDHHYWVGDIAGLYTLSPGSGDAIKLIEKGLALADVAPLSDLSHWGTPGPFAGYSYAVILLQRDNIPYDTGNHFNAGSFAYCAYPATYRGLHSYTFIINENNSIYWRDSHVPKRIMKWPSEDELRQEWKLLESPWNIK